MGIAHATQYRPVLKGFETIELRPHDITERLPTQYRPVLKGFETLPAHRGLVQRRKLRSTAPF